MIFNGIDMSEYFRVNEIKGRGLGPQEIQMIEVLGRDGAYYAGKRLPSREIDVRITIIAEDPESLREKIIAINEIFDVSEPVPIQFPDEMQYTYFGIPTEISESYEFTYFHQTSFKVICPSPYKFGEEIIVDFPSDYVNVMNRGSGKTSPIFEMEVLEDTTFAMIQNQYNEYMLIGDPTEVDTPTYKRYERVYYTDALSLTGWTQATVGDVDGMISGTMVARDDRFTTGSFGEGTGWYGPAMKTSLPEQLQDFRMSAWVSNYNGNNPSDVGRVELYLLDSSGVTVAKVAMSDGSARISNLYGSVSLGELGSRRNLIHEHGARQGAWNNFGGTLRVEREGNNWYAYIGMGTTGKQRARRIVRWTDYHNLYTLPISQIVVRFAKYNNYEAPYMGVHSIIVEKINQPSSNNEVDLTLRQGDILLIDHEEEAIYVNGEERNDLVTFGSNFFKLHKGGNELFVYPNNTFATKLTYREVFR